MSRWAIVFLSTAIVAGSACPAAHAADPTPKIVSNRKIWDRGQHNAFTDLIRFRDCWYCTFREAEDHVGGDGGLPVLVSSNGRDWDLAGVVAEAGVDLRDPKLSITPDGRLMIVAGGSIYRGTKILQGRQPRVAFSDDGRQWTAPQRVLGEGDWLWRVTWHDGRAWGAAYQHRANQLAAGTGEWALKLYSSSDGVHYDLVTPLKVPDRPNETTLRFLADGRMMALVRREAGNRNAWIGTSRLPYKAWDWHEASHPIGGPNFIQLPDGKLWAAGRLYQPARRTMLATMTAEDFRPVFDLPSSGDTSYPGLVWHDNLLWMSYYSSHEGKTSIYLATIKLNGE